MGSDWKTNVAKNYKKTSIKTTIPAICLHLSGSLPDFRNLKPRIVFNFEFAVLELP